ncbi:MAG: hypothetical protein WCK47_01150 [bacterium]
MKRIMLICPAVMLLAVIAVAQTTATRPAYRSDFHTILQTATPWEPKSNVQTDMALVASDESALGIKLTADKLRSWKGKGYRIFGFASVARVYDYYMKGGWRDLAGVEDKGGHEGEVQRDRFGARFGPHEFMMMPTLRLLEHKKLWAKAFIDGGAEGMAFEEPDIFMNGGYNESFKKEWQDYYKAPWQPPHSSIAARVKSERLKAYIGLRCYKILSEYCKSLGGKDFKFMLAAHSLPNYLLWGVSFNYFETLALPTVDILQAQVWTGSAKTPVLFEGKLEQRIFDNAFVDYSYCVNLAEALGKEVWLNLDPYEDEPGLAFDFYKMGFENTLAASLMFPQAGKWEILPWPNRIYTNDRIPPLYGTEIQNVIAAMSAMGPVKKHDWNKRFPKTGILFSESALFEMRDPHPSNPQSLFALALPLMNMGIPVDVVPLETADIGAYINRFKILFLSYDCCKPPKPEYHAALARWVKERGGVLVVVGGLNAYNDAPSWWREKGYASPTAHLLEQLGLGRVKTQLTPQRPKDIQYTGVQGSTANQHGAANQGGVQRNDAFTKLFQDFFKDLKGADHIPRRVSFVPNDQHPESNYLYTAIDPGAARKGFRFDSGQTADFRYCDGPGFFSYKFIMNGLKSFKVKADITHNYVIEASTDETNWKELAHSYKLSGGEVRNQANRKELTLDLSEFISTGPVFLRFRDPSPQDGWGPLVFRMTLEPEYAVEPPPSDAPLALRDAYGIAYGVLPKAAGRVFVSGGKAPVVFNTDCGNGEVFVIGAPPALFAASKEKSDVLRAMFSEICRRHKYPLDADGIFHLTRGNYHVIHPISRAAKLAGQFIDILSPELPVIVDPEIPVGTPKILLAMNAHALKRTPSLCFASHRLRDVVERPGRLEFVIEGPERIPAVCRLRTGNREPKSITAVALADGKPVKIGVIGKIDSVSGTRLVQFGNRSGGVRVVVECDGGRL